MFDFLAMAGPAGGGAAGGGNPAQPLIMLALMFGIFYFLLIRPQQKKVKAHRELIASLKTGDEVVTAGGIHGKVAGVEEDVITVEVAAGVKMKFNRSSITAKS